MQWPFYAGAYLPLVIGYSVFVLGYIFLFGSYGVLHWRAERYRFNSVSQFCLVSCLLLVITLQLVYSLEVLSTYRATYVVFCLTYNTAVAMVPAYLQRLQHKALDFPTFLKLKHDDPVLTPTPPPPHHHSLASTLLLVTHSLCYAGAQKLIDEMKRQQMQSRWSMVCISHYTSSAPSLSRLLLIGCALCSY